MTEIDGLRCVAIVAVFCLHLSTHYRRLAIAPFAVSPDRTLAGYLAGQGGLGVAVFFAISGFILALPFARRHLLGAPPPSLGRYYLRRLVRIEPPYFLVLALLAVGQMTLREQPWPQIGPHLFASLLYVHNLVYGVWSTIDPVAWSLEIEVQFYLIAPALSCVLALRPTVLRRGALLLLIAVGAAGSAVFRPALTQWHLDRSLLSEGHFFLCGLLAADLYLLRPPAVSRRGGLFDAVAALAAIGLCVTYTAADPASRLLATACVLCLLIATLFGQRWRTGLRWRPVAVVGGMCYSLYLLHYPLLALWLPHTRSLRLSEHFGINLFVQGTIAFPPIMAAAALFFTLVERPCMVAARRWSGLSDASQIAQNAPDAR